ncbi:MAG TPA: type II CAAX endopeptidase family protein [Candidatus Saccharimonadia bacterium]|nr:type II CAAX endopeptidase family protein [Candidatus Saccharimonadia bacterium]
MDEIKKDKKYWGPIQTLLLSVFIFLFTQIIVGLLINGYFSIRHFTPQQSQNWINNSAMGLFIETLLIEALTILSVWIFLKIKKVGFKKIGLYGLPVLKDLGYLVLGFVSYFVIYFISVSVLKALVPGFNISQKQDLGIPSVAYGADLWLFFFMLVVLPPIAEEILFRGFLYTGLKQKLNKILAALITSIAFAAPHLFETNSSLLWVAGLDTFILSMVLVYVREKTGRLWAGMGIHFLKNFVAFASLYLLHNS